MNLIGGWTAVKKFYFETLPIALSKQIGILLKFGMLRNASEQIAADFLSFPSPPKKIESFVMPPKQ